MDELDERIVRQLQTDARLSNRELARRVGAAASTCLERVRALTRRGVIRGYHADIDLAALNRGVQALVSIRLRTPSRAAIDVVKRDVSRMPEVMGLFVVAGEDDMVLHVAVPDLDRLHAVLVEQLAPRPEIGGFRTSVIFQHTRRNVLESLGEPPA